MAATLVGGLAWVKGEWVYAAPLLAFFVTSSLLGKLPGGKQKHGPRNAAQVLANGGMAAVATLVPGGETAYVAALCAANADTWATEIGTRLGRRPWRITTLRPAEPGVSGAVSLPGLLAAAAGAALVAAAGAGIAGAALAAAGAIGFAACLLDSVLGDTLQARFRTADGAESESEGAYTLGVRWIRNDMVNFMMTAFAALAGYLIG